MMPTIPRYTSQAQRHPRRGIRRVTDDVHEAVRAADVVYIDTWWWVDQEDEIPERRAAFMPSRGAPCPPAAGVAARQASEWAELVARDQHLAGSNAAVPELVHGPAGGVGLVGEADLQVLGVACDARIGEAGRGRRTARNRHRHRSSVYLLSLEPSSPGDPKRLAVNTVDLTAEPGAERP
jgi:hypothetical protein